MQEYDNLQCLEKNGIMHKNDHQLLGKAKRHGVLKAGQHHNKFKFFYRNANLTLYMQREKKLTEN